MSESNGSGLRLAGKVCMVTGAGRGIGAGIAARLAREGASAIVADLDVDAAAATADAIERAGGRAAPVSVDVGDRDSVRRAIAEGVARFGRLDVMYNNAGISRSTPFLDVTEDEFSTVMRVNGLGVLFGIQEAAEQMRRQGDGGKIVNTASKAGKEGAATFASYCASKFVAVSLTQSAAYALAADKITVNAFCPGIVTTELWDRLDADFIAMGVADKPGEALESFISGIPLGRASTPEDVAGVAAFLASSDSDYMTGQAINIDGGVWFH